MSDIDKDLESSWHANAEYGVCVRHQNKKGSDSEPIADISVRAAEKNIINSEGCKIKDETSAAATEIGSASDSKEGEAPLPAVGEPQGSIDGNQVCMERDEEWAKDRSSSEAADRVCDVIGHRLPNAESTGGNGTFPSDKAAASSVFEAPATHNSRTKDPVQTESSIRTGYAAGEAVYSAAKTEPDSCYYDSKNQDRETIIYSPFSEPDGDEMAPISGILKPPPPSTAKEPLRAGNDWAPSFGAVTVYLSSMGPVVPIPMPGFDLWSSFPDRSASVFDGIAADGSPLAAIHGGDMCEHGSTEATKGGAATSHIIPPRPRPEPLRGCRGS
eukprot:GHVU01150540.1.p1 GENE.GHVU01150540.1~~GHVU01150540.1.p1  ORF type:complete len:329 (-),score=40.67 GHVU01150540.1:244-1230(-)